MNYSSVSFGGHTGMNKNLMTRMSTCWASLWGQINQKEYLRGISLLGETDKNEYFLGISLRTDLQEKIFTRCLFKERLTRDSTY